MEDFKNWIQQQKNNLDEDIKGVNELMKEYQRVKTLTIKISQYEKDLIMQEVMESGMTLSQYVRHKLDLMP